MHLSRCCKINYWPGITCGWFLLTFVISYLVSVLDGNVYAFFPYISDTGALPPESCIFGQMLNIGAVLMMISMYIRYEQVDLGIKFHHVKLKKMWNVLGLVFGSTACFGMSLVANFQETAVGEVHFLGAMLAYGVGILYFYVQTRISFAYNQINSTSSAAIYKVRTPLLVFRIFLAFWLLPLFLSNIICAIMSTEQFTGESIVWWTEEDGGFELRLVGSFTEWILTLFIFIYIATFTNEFKILKYKGVHFDLKNDGYVGNNALPMA